MPCIEVEAMNTPAILLEGQIWCTKFRLRNIGFAKLGRLYVILNDPGVIADTQRTPKEFLGMYSKFELYYESKQLIKFINKLLL